MTIELKIRLEIFRAFKHLGADRELLSIIGSWGDTMDDKEALKLLKEWNTGIGARHFLQCAAILSTR